MIHTANNEEQAPGEASPDDIHAIGEELQNAKGALIRELCDVRTGGIYSVADLIQSKRLIVDASSGLERITLDQADLVTFSAFNHGTPPEGKALVASRAGYTFHVKYSTPA